MNSPSAKSAVTRGTGILESMLARRRAQKANSLIPLRLRSGKILDIGCGSYPYFLTHTMFKEKYAVDQLHAQWAFADIMFTNLSLAEQPSLPFPDKFFTVITLLAVAEHLHPDHLNAVLQDCSRKLCPGGMLILTTPAAWTDKILRALAAMRLVSPEEIHDHKFKYTSSLLGWHLGKAGFQIDKLQFGSFECGMNLWVTAERGPDGDTP